ncbi:MAG: DNA polymerase sliding clamp [Pyrodictiaceae archaeon]
MFRAVYPAATKFKYIVQTIAKIVDEIPFIATQEALEVRRLTPDKTTMIILRLPMTSFDEYDVEGDEVTFIVPSDELNRVAKRGTRNDVVELVLEEEERRLKLIFKDKKTGVSRAFYINLREGIVEKLAEPQVSLTVSFKMMAEDLKNIINDVKIIGDEAEFIAYEDRVEVRTETQQKSYINILEADKALIFYELRGEAPIRSKYSIDLLKATTKAASTADTVSLEYGEALPMKISFDLPGGGLLIYWVSPRV